MGKLNNFLKWVVMNVNLLYAAVALVAIILSVIVLVSDWGSLDRGFFMGWCIVIILFSTLIVMISLLGCMGVSHQSEKLSCWTGRRILGLYQLALLVTIIGVIWGLTQLVIISRGLNATYDDLTRHVEDDTYELAYSKMEDAVSSRFNDFFFSAAATCTDSKFVFFWSWVNDYCPVSISQENCMACGEYSVTNCPADENLCFQKDDKGQAFCPYDQCREGVLEYLTAYLNPMNIGFLALALFQLMIMMLTCMLICFTPQDSVEQMLVKTGTISEQDLSRQRRRRERASQNPNMV